MKPQRVYVTGLPRAGSTLLCQLLAQHPDITCDGMTSPLFGMVESLRSHLAGNDAFLSRLDVAGNLSYARLASVYRGIISGWLDQHHGSQVTVDKNRGWLHAIEFLAELDPDFRALVCIRDLGQLFGSVESAHRRTNLIGYRDGMSHHSADARANQLFSESGIIGAPLNAIREFNAGLKTRVPAQQIYYVAYEALLTEPVATMQRVYDFIGLDQDNYPFKLDPSRLTVFPQESDSHYGMKWPHDTHNQILPIKQHNIPAEIESTLQERYAWYYQNFYSSEQNNIVNSNQ
jgi:sulfotransferase